jgi:Fe-S cluster assembly ATPase SufC
MVDGRIVQSGGPEVALELEADGYKTYEEASSEAAR